MRRNFGGVRNQGQPREVRGSNKNVDHGSISPMQRSPYSFRERINLRLALMFGNTKQKQICRHIPAFMAQTSGMKCSRYSK